MPKIEINKAAEIMKKNQLEPKILRQIIEEMNRLMEAEAEEEKPPAIKKQFCILISDPDSLLPKTDFAGWVLQIPETESAATTESRIHRAIYDYNASKKGRLYPAKTIGEALENVNAHFFKDNDVWVKTKVPVLILRTTNELPDERQAKIQYSTEATT